MDVSPLVEDQVVELVVPVNDGTDAFTGHRIPEAPPELAEACVDRRARLLQLTRPATQLTGHVARGAPQVAEADGVGVETVQLQQHVTNPIRCVPSGPGPEQLLRLRRGPHDQTLDVLHHVPREVWVWRRVALGQPSEDLRNRQIRVGQC